MFPFTKRKEGRHASPVTPSEHCASPAADRTARPPLTAEEHVVAIRKLAAVQCSGRPRGDIFTVTYNAPKEMYLDMEMQFIAYADHEAPYDTRGPFVYRGARGSTYRFEVT